LLLLSAAAASDQSWLAGALLGLAGAGLLLRAMREAAYSQSTLQQLLGAPEPAPASEFGPLAAPSDAE